MRDFEQFDKWVYRRFDSGWWEIGEMRRSLDFKQRNCLRPLEK